MEQKFVWIFHQTNFLQRQVCLIIKSLINICRDKACLVRLIFLMTKMFNDHSQMKLKLENLNFENDFLVGRSQRDGQAHPLQFTNSKLTKIFLMCRKCFTIDCRDKACLVRLMLEMILISFEKMKNKLHSM